jgi:protein tyrosine phosphatase (PTP) superfamily phosphohydrolase (DUF442 family)
MGDCIEDISNFLWLSDRIATAGQPTIEQYATIAVAGYQIVINLALKDSPNAVVNEAQIVEDLGLEYVHIPVEWDAPTLADFQIFVNRLDLHLAQNIFIHCAANKRVSVFTYLYRIQRGIDESTAAQDLAKIWTPNRVWQDFIDRIGFEYSQGLR